MGSLRVGPAVVLSYLIASLTSMITGLCYTEFAVEAGAYTRPASSST